MAITHFPSRIATAIALFALGASTVSPAQLPDNSTVVRGVDVAVAAREEKVLAYTVTEHYSIFRYEDKDHPAAEVTVKTDYRKDKGKTYTILAESGSSLIRSQVIPRILQSEREVTHPANRAQALITSANYNMQVKAEGKVGGRNCLLLDISPRRNSPYLFSGKLWVDAKDDSIVQLQGVASKSPSMFTGATQVSRTYDRFDGFPMATHAYATSSSWLLGHTTIQIEYTGYQITLDSSHAADQ